MVQRWISVDGSEIRPKKCLLDFPYLSLFGYRKRNECSIERANRHSIAFLFSSFLQKKKLVFFFRFIIGFHVVIYSAWVNYIRTEEEEAEEKTHRIHSNDSMVEKTTEISHKISQRSDVNRCGR